MLRPVALLALLVLIGCASTLPTQRRLAGYVADAKKACKSDGRRCAAAKLCSHSAVDAAEAVQKGRQAVAEGREDAEAALRAASLPVTARTLCESLGFSSEVTP